MPPWPEPLAARGDTVALVARRADRLDAVLADCRATSPDSDALGGRPRRIPTVAADLALDDLGPLRRTRRASSTTRPSRCAATSRRLTMAEVERTMRINYLSPVAISLAVLPRMLVAWLGHDRQRLEPRADGWASRPRRPTRGSKFALAGWSESMAIDLDGSGRAR